MWNLAFPRSMLLGRGSNCWVALLCGTTSALASMQSLLTASCCSRKEVRYSSFSFPWLFLHALCEDPHSFLCPPSNSRQLCKHLYCTYSTWRKAILLRGDNNSSSAITGCCFEVSEKSCWKTSLLPTFSLQVWTINSP